MSERDAVLRRLAASEGRHFLLTEHEDGRTSLDGCHSEPAGVARAAHLYGALGFGRGVKRRVMITIEPCPEPNAAGVNHEAVRALNGIGLRA